METYCLPGLVLVVGLRQGAPALWAVFACWTLADCMDARAEFESVGMTARFVVFTRAELLARPGGRALFTECEEHVGDMPYLHLHWGYTPGLLRVFGPRMVRLLAEAVCA